MRSVRGACGGGRGAGAYLACGQSATSVPAQPGAPNRRSRSQARIRRERARRRSTREPKSHESSRHHARRLGTENGRRLGLQWRAQALSGRDVRPPRRLKSSTCVGGVFQVRGRVPLLSLPQWRVPPVPFACVLGCLLPCSLPRMFVPRRPSSLCQDLG
jgi:hypothetical protein